MEDGIVVDMRSDIVTKPTSAMRRAMAAAEVGWDPFKEDTTVNELQSKMAEMLGKEDALFVASGTMGNLIAVSAHCYENGGDVIVGHKSHIFRYQRHSLSKVGGVQTFQIRNLEDGTLDLGDLETAVRIDHVYVGKTRLISLENTHNICGGKAIPLSFHEKVRQIADKNNLKIHLDGARLMNASIALGVTSRDVAQYCDSVSMCFTKGLGAPVGSIIAGTKNFISKARQLRHELGGMMAMPGILAAAANVALMDAEERLRRDHQNTRKFIQVFERHGSGKFKLDNKGILTNIILCRTSGTISRNQFLERLEKITADEFEETGCSVKIKGYIFPDEAVRLTLHSDLSDEMIEKGLKKLQYVLQELDV